MDKPKANPEERALLADANTFAADPGSEGEISQDPKAQLEDFSGTVAGPEVTIATFKAGVGA